MTTSNYKMPTLGSDMEHAIITKWYIHEGDKLNPGDTVAEIETEKHNMEITAWEQGFVKKIFHKVGDDVAVGSILFSFDNLKVDDHSQVKISPRAKKIIKDQNIDIDKISNKSKKEILNANDILMFKNNKVLAKKSTQEVVAKLVEKSKKEIPHFYIEKTINHTSLINFITEKNKKLSIEDRQIPVAYYIKVMAIALGKYPTFNCTYEKKVISHDLVNLAIITQVKNKGVYAPVLRDISSLSISQIMRSLKELITNTRDGALKERETTDSTISLTNLGDSGADKVYGVIFPPHSSLIGIGGVNEKGECCWTMSIDHRVSNGMEASKFLRTINHLINNPHLIG